MVSQPRLILPVPVLKDCPRAPAPICLPPQSVQEASARAVGSMLSGLLNRYPTNQHAACTDIYALGVNWRPGAARASVGLPVFFSGVLAYAGSCRLHWFLGEVSRQTRVPAGCIDSWARRHGVMLIFMLLNACCPVPPLPTGEGLAIERCVDKMGSGCHQPLTWHEPAQGEVRLAALARDLG